MCYLMIIPVCSFALYACVVLSACVALSACVVCLRCSLRCLLRCVVRCASVRVRMPCAYVKVPGARRKLSVAIKAKDADALASAIHQAKALELKLQVRVPSVPCSLL